MTTDQALEKDKIEKVLLLLGDTFQKHDVNPWTACAALHIMLAKLEAQDVVLQCETEIIPVETGNDEVH